MRELRERGTAVTPDNLRIAAGAHVIFGRDIDRQPLPQVGLLRRDAYRAVVGVTGAHAETPDRL